MRNINYGVIGAGYFGSELGRVLSKVEGATIKSVYDPERKNALKLSAELNCAVDHSIDSLCDRADIDAVIVASPNGYHKEPVIKSAKNKKHIFCEKPIALSYKDCKEMIDSARENGVIFMAGHVMNFMNGVRKAKELINDGVIGDVLFCHAQRNGWEEPQQDVSWKKMRDISGGHLYHHIHELDFIQFIMGPAKQATMVGGNVAHQGESFGDEDDMLFITLEFEGNRFATLQYGSAFRWADHFVKIQGEKGAILIDMQDVKVVLKTSNHTETFLLHRTKEEDDDRTNIYLGSETDGAIMYGNPHKKPPLWLQGIIEMEMNYFHSILQGGEAEEEFKPLLDGTAAMASIATADALTRSIHEDRKVYVKEVLSDKDDIRSH
ncbi:Gfo/Idh/MocA family protein [Virgibacillus halophilus]|uniref:Gfo/Idh/MocA family oxidoreductase n=1 Tax=Tigheibacillus halophilus TaxID=361280 RepID=A0ABU5C5C1_9BACI|nr:Gfo/Idh/MocA family oxidoreductase [Virgibacillus halophilus]